MGGDGPAGDGCAPVRGPRADRPGFFDYGPARDADVVEWHVNFADPELFVAYAGGLFAQDEMQVAEHPILAAVREAALASVSSSDCGLRAADADSRRRRRAARLCRHGPGLALGRPNGMYGNSFAAAAPKSSVRHDPIDPPTITNVIAMAAHAGGNGGRRPYTPDEIRMMLVTAYTGFRAAVLESRGLPGRDGAVSTPGLGLRRVRRGPSADVLVQVLAARMAGLRWLVFHTGSAGGDAPLAEAVALLDELTGDGPVETQALLGTIRSGAPVGHERRQLTFYFSDDFVRGESVAESACFLDFLGARAIGGRPTRERTVRPAGTLKSLAVLGRPSGPRGRSRHRHAPPRQTLASSMLCGSGSSGHGDKSAISRDG